MSFNPFDEKGVPIEKQVKNWSEMNTKPYDPETVHPYTRTRGILMNGIETEAALFYHHFHRHTDNMDLRRQLSLLRRIEQQEQKMVNWAIPGQETTLEVTIGYEQLAVDLTASMAKKEPDPYVKATLDFALIEDFDHLYRYANLMLEIDPKKAEAIVRDFTEVTPGRPTVIEHRHPFDTVRKFVDRTTADPLTLMHIFTITAAEQQTMNYYMNVGNRFTDNIARGLYQEIGMIEEQHVTLYGALADPRASWFEMAVFHEYNECYLYYSCMISESDSRIKKVWQQMLDNEITHLQIARENMLKYDKKDPADLYPKELPSPLILESSKEYVRQIIATQLDFTGDSANIVPLKKAESRERYLQFQTLVNGGEMVPSQQVITNAINKTGMDYRVETLGDHPVQLLNNRKNVPSQEQLLKSMIS
jgi:rubrerythrin